MAQRNYVTHPLVLRELTVVRAANVTPRMRRITVTGEQLKPFNRDGFDLPGFITESFDDHVKMVFAADDDIESALPVQRARSIDWPPAENRLARDYTPRRWDPETNELDFDFVIHGHGPAVEFARGARPGDTVHFVGPKSSLVIPSDVEWMLLAGDETALPSIGRFLDERPHDVPVDVVVEIGDESARQDLAIRPGDTVRWVKGSTGDGSSLLDAVRAVNWRDGIGFAWGAGENASMLGLRRWLRGAHGMATDHVDVTGYWHREDEVETVAAPLDAHTLLNPLPWLAARSAVDLGLLDALVAEPLASSELANLLTLDADAFGVLVNYLVSIDVLRRDDDQIALGRIGEELLDDDHLREELFGDGVEARTLLALTQLAPALRTGTTAWSQAFGQSLAVDADTDAALYADRVDTTETFAFVAGSLFELPAWKSASQVVVTGPGAANLVGATMDLPDRPNMVIAAGPIGREVLSEHAADLPVSVVDENQAPVADLAINICDTMHRDDAELVEHFAGLGRFADTVLVVDESSHTGPGSGVSAEHPLLFLGGNGIPPRDSAHIARLAAEAGWQVVSETKLGWDFEAFELRR